MYPGYLDEVGGRRAGSTFNWSPAMSIEDMDKSGIAMSVLSLIQPSAVTTRGRERTQDRAPLERIRRTARARPQGPLRELRDAAPPRYRGNAQGNRYALNTLKRGHRPDDELPGQIPGGCIFAPIWEELNRRKRDYSPIPLSPECCRNIKSEVPPAVVEYATDTTRTIASLVFSERVTHPDIR